MKKKILLQLKFILVALINFVYNYIPFPLRTFFLKCLAIKVGKNTTIQRTVKFFHIV